MEIDANFLDVDLEQEAARHGYQTGCLGYEGEEVLMAAPFGDAVPLVPRSQWKGLCQQIETTKSSGAYLVTRIYDQGQEGSCVANAAAQAHEICQSLQFGHRQVVPLSAISLYKRIGSSPNSGSYVSSALRELCSRGILPLATEDNRRRFAHTMPNTGFYQPFPSGWEQTASHFRIHEYYRTWSVDELISALLLGFPVIVGRRGHAICYVQPFYRNDCLYVLYVNSWGKWGQAAGYMAYGFGVDSYALIEQAANGAVVVRSVTSGVYL